MKKIFVGMLVWGWILLMGSSPAHAILIEFVPSSQDVVMGNPVDVEIVISDLGDLTDPSLGVFDLDVDFDPTILSFNSVVYGDPMLGDQLDLFGLGSITTTTPGTGSVNLSELSLDSPTDLDTLQAGTFTLATLTFDTVGIGTSLLSFSDVVLGDALGISLSADLGSGGITVSGGGPVVIPEPTTLLLVGFGLVGLGIVRKTKK